VRTSRLTDAAPIVFDLKPGRHRGIRCSRVVERSRYAAGEEEILAASHGVSALVVLLASVFPDAGRPRAGYRTGSAINQQPLTLQTMHIKKVPRTPS
jgi:hypothetical protein